MKWINDLRSSLGHATAQHLLQKWPHYQTTGTASHLLIVSLTSCILHYILQRDSSSARRSNSRSGSRKINLCPMHFLRNWDQNFQESEMPKTQSSALRPGVHTERPFFPMLGNLPQWVALTPWVPRQDPESHPVGIISVLLFIKGASAMGSLM